MNPPSSTNANASSSIKPENDAPFVIVKDSGMTGLKNLGNTCYLNSALQSICHLKELIEYFTEGAFASDIQLNKDLCNSPQQNSSLYSFNNFIRQMWSARTKKCLIPSEFRESLIALYPEFNNNNQQDAHEILTLILDTLSSALNRVKNDGKTITQAINQDNIGLSLLTSTQSSIWNNSHRAFNDSFIIDLFFGQMQSTLQCCYCHSIVNLNYDPFSCLELPIPNEYKIFLYFIPIKKGMRPMKMFIKINDNLQFKHIIPKVKHLTDYNLTNGTFYWVFNNKLEKIIDNEERCGDLMMRMSFLFLIEKSPGKSNDNHKRQFYSSLNFALLNEEGGSEPIEITFPRVFSFDIAQGEAIVYTSIWNEINEYVRSYLNGSEAIEVLIRDKMVRFSVRASCDSAYHQQSNGGADRGDEGKLYGSAESEDGINLNSNGDTKAVSDTLYRCIFCQQSSQMEFQCECINTLLSNPTLDLKANSYLRSFIENLRKTFILHVTVRIAFDLLKFKELNRCRDYTAKLISEKELDIYDLCDYFFAEEKIMANYNCPNCGLINSSFKKQELHRFPKVLILHLKRFKYELPRQKGKEDKSILNIGEKNDTPIEFRNEIDLTKYNQKNIPAKYQLNSIIYHKGKISSGHYTAICKHPYCGKWIEFDDKNTSFINEYSLPKEDAYILFYRQLD